MTHTYVPGRWESVLQYRIGVHRRWDIIPWVIKMKRSNRRVIEDLKKRKRKKFLIKKIIIVKIYLGISLELLQAVWFCFSFR